MDSASSPVVDPTPDPFTRVVRAPTLSEKVTSQLLESILSGRLGPGDALPSERELGDRFGVSRTVIREAVRALVAKGVVVSRPGSGLRVAAVGPSQVSESMRLYLRASGALSGTLELDYAKIHEVREMLEIRVAGVAAERATDAEIADLRAVHERLAGALDDVEVASRMDVEFHRALARLTHNPLYLVMLDSIGELLLEIRRTTLARPGRPGEAVEFHARILARVAARDPDGARAAMEAHLRDSERVWRERPQPAAGS